MAEKTPFLETVDQIRDENERRNETSDNTKQELAENALTLMAIYSAIESAS